MKCHPNPSTKDSGSSEVPAKRRNVLGLIGLCCTGVCVVGLPLLSLVLSAVGMAWTGHGWVTWTLLAFSLVMFGLGLGASFRHHRHRGPAVMAILGALFLLAKATHLLSSWAEWAGMGALLGAWFWDRMLRKRSCLMAESNARAESSDEVLPPEKEVSHDKP